MTATFKQFFLKRIAPLFQFLPVRNEVVELFCSVGNFREQLFVCLRGTCNARPHLLHGLNDGSLVFTDLRSLKAKLLPLSTQALKVFLQQDHLGFHLLILALLLAQNFPEDFDTVLKLVHHTQGDLQLAVDVLQLGLGAQLIVLGLNVPSLLFPEQLGLAVDFHLVVLLLDHNCAVVASLSAFARLTLRLDVRNHFLLFPQLPFNLFVCGVNFVSNLLFALQLALRLLDLLVQADQLGLKVSRGLLSV